MDQRLKSWALRVKSRNERADIPPLWYFTDAGRGGDPCAVAARLPRGLCGVVLRHDDDPDRPHIARSLARICRARGNRLVIAGDAGLAHSLRAGLHLRGGKPVRRDFSGLITSSAHNPAEIRRALRAGATLLFISPLFATQSHPGAAGLGLLRWMRLAARNAGISMALGGVDAKRLRQLKSPRIAGLGAIGAMEGE